MGVSGSLKVCGMPLILKAKTVLKDRNDSIILKSPPLTDVQSQDPNLLMMIIGAGLCCLLHLH